MGLLVSRDGPWTAMVLSAPRSGAGIPAAGWISDGPGNQNAAGRRTHDGCSSTDCPDRSTDVRRWTLRSPWISGETPPWRHRPSSLS